MKTSTTRTMGLAPLVVVTAGALLSACGPQDGGNAPATAATSTPQAVAAAATTPAATQAPAQTAAPKLQKVAAAAPRPDSVGAVKSIEPITETKSTGAGAVVGGVLGGVVGNQFGKGDGKKAMTVVGAVGGAVAGNEIERHKNKKVVGYRVKVQLDNGESRTFEPAQLGDLKVGDRVRVDHGQLRKA
jgi:outer membrane lipoprotein SlyB